MTAFELRAAVLALFAERDAAEAKLAEAERERDIARYDRAHGAATDVANLQARAEALDDAARRAFAYLGDGQPDDAYKVLRAALARKEGP